MEDTEQASLPTPRPDKMFAFAGHLMNLVRQESYGRGIRPLETLGALGVCLGRVVAESRMNKTYLQETVKHVIRCIEYGFEHPSHPDNQVPTNSREYN